MRSLPLSTQLAAEGLLVGVGHHVPSQVFLVLGGEAAAGTLVRPQVRVEIHVVLGVHLNRIKWLQH